MNINLLSGRRRYLVWSRTSYNWLRWGGRSLYQWFRCWRWNKLWIYYFNFGIIQLVLFTSSPVVDTSLLARTLFQTMCKIFCRSFLSNICFKISREGNSFCVPLLIHLAIDLGAWLILCFIWVCTFTDLSGSPVSAIYLAVASFPLKVRGISFPKLLGSTNFSFSSNSISVQQGSFNLITWNSACSGK